MPTPHIAAPPLPQTLELDTHSKQFFDPVEWSSPVQVRFKLNSPALADIVYIGRAARFRTGAIHLVVREFNGNPEVDSNTSCLLSALPFATVELDERDDYLRRYFARHLMNPSLDVRCRSDWRERVPTLRGAVANTGLRRLHSDAATGLGFIFGEEGREVLNLGCERRWKEATRPKIHLGGAFFGFAPPQNPARALVEMDSASFHARVEELLHDDGNALSTSVAFYRMGLRERCRHVFGCEGEAQIQAREMQELALTLELGVDGTLENWASAQWRPWAQEEVIEGVEESGQSVYSDVPPRLTDWVKVIGEKTGCKVNKEISGDDAGLDGFARRWAREYVVST